MSPKAPKGALALQKRRFASRRAKRGGEGGAAGHKQSDGGYPPPAEREGEGAERRGRASGASRACDSTRGCSRSGNRRDFTSEGLGGAESFAEENLLDGGANS